jgi:hypothetical protein
LAPPFLKVEKGGKRWKKVENNKIDINNLHKDKFITNLFINTILKWI